jgi:hypothetical protein
MFYGGRLLSHLTTTQTVDEFISLRRLNQWLVILIDSDKSAPEDPINATKTRIVDEFDAGEGFAWVTAGREIENYVRPDVFERCVRQAHAAAEPQVSGAIFDDWTRIQAADGELRGIDKIRVSHLVAETEPDLGVLDLQDRMVQLADFIHRANGVED